MWLAVGGMIVVALAVFAPWVIAVAVRYPEAWAFWKAELLKLSKAKDPNAPAVTLDTIRPWYYYLQAFIWTAPFIPLFVAGLCLPFFRRQESEWQRGRWLAWAVTAGGFVLLSFPAVKEQRYAVQLLPFTALLCAMALEECVAWLKRRHADKWTTRRAGVAFVLCAWILAVAVNGINRGSAANHTNAFRPGVEQAARIVGRSPAAVLPGEEVPPWLATAYYFDRMIPQLIVPNVVALSLKHPQEAMYVLEWSQEGQRPTWQLDALRTLTGRKTETVLTFEAEGHKLTVTKLDVPTLLIDASPAASRPRRSW